MSDLKHTILFPGSGLNTDDSNLYMALGDSPYRVHILTGEEGQNGVLTLMKGNKKASYELTGSNTYQVGGSYYNRLTRKVYYFVFSQPFDVSGSPDYGDFYYDNHLLEFDEDTETITNIFTDTKNYFGIDIRYLICDCDMIGSILYFNTRVSEPKMIDVVRAYNYTTYAAWLSTSTYNYGEKVRFFGGVFVANAAIAAGESPSTHTTKWDRVGDSYQDETMLGDVYDNELRYAFNVIRQTPVYRPQCIYGTDDNKNANNVRGKLFRFALRYKYWDNTDSKFGAYSDVTLPDNDEYYNGEVPDDLDAYNYISVSFNLHSPSLIKEIEIAFQETGGVWKAAKRVNRWEQALLDDVSYTFKFYNNEPSYPVLDDTLFKEIYDSVPRISGQQELINKNILTYGRCKEGFNNIDKDLIDVALTPEIEALTIPESVKTAGRYRDNIASGDWSSYYAGMDKRWINTLDFTLWYPTFGMAAGDIFTIRINGVTRSYIVQVGDLIDIDSFIVVIYKWLKVQFPALASSIYAGSGWTGTIAIQTTSNIDIGISTFYEPSGTGVQSLTKYTGFKTGSWHPFCVYYYDDGMRRCDAQTSKENVDGTGYSINGTTVYVPMLNEMSPPSTDTANRFKINWSLNHNPPEWAKWWRWGYGGGSLCSDFVQYTITSIATEFPLVKIDIAPLQTLKSTDESGWNEFPQSIIDPWQWVQGDRVRIITLASAASNLGEVVDGVNDFEILKYEETTSTPINYYIYTQNFDIIGLGPDTLIEIYRPLRTNTQQVFYEYGDIMPIIEDSAGVRVHGCGATGTQNQDSVLDLPATGVFEHGDVYHIIRTPSKPIDTIVGFFMESQWYSDFYLSQDWDKGRIGVETSFGERTLNIVRYSNQYLQNTGINGLSTFEALNYKELTDMYGDMVGMMENGNTLKVYFEKNSCSILIGRQEYVDDQGQITIASSNTVLGSVRYSNDTIGTQLIESLEKNNRYIYGADAYNGCIWRDSANGIFPISGRQEIAGQGNDYKMSSWFKEKFDALALSGLENCQVILTWDEKYQLLYVIIKDNANKENNDTIIFHEPSNRWITFTELEQTPDGGYNVMLELDYEIVKGFDNGIGYFFDEDTRFAVFNIPHTSERISAYPAKQDITMTLYNPTILISSDVEMSMLGLVISPINPVAFISYVHASKSGVRDIVQTFNFAYDAYGESTFIEEYTAIYTNPACTVISITNGSWLSLKNITTGVLLTQGATINDLTTFKIFPNSINTAEERTAVITLRNPSPYLNTCVITVVQAESAFVPTVNVSVYSAAVTYLSIAGVTYSIFTGATTVTITFTPTHSDYAVGEFFITRWFANIGDTTIGSTAFTTINGQVNTTTLSLLAPVNTGDVLDVYFDANRKSVDQIVATGLQTVTLTQYDPTILITRIDASVVNMSWAHNEYGLASKEGTVITADNAPAMIQSLPSWITITDASDNPIYVGQYITGGSTIYIFPTEYNYSVERLGEVLIVNEYGDYVTIAVLQTQYVPPVGDIVTATVEVSPFDSFLEININSDFPPIAFSYTTSTNVQIQFYPYNRLASYGEPFTIYWKSMINNVEKGRGSFTGYVETETYETVTLSETPEVGEVVKVLISINEII